MIKLTTFFSFIISVFIFSQTITGDYYSIESKCKLHLKIDDKNNFRFDINEKKKSDGTVKISKEDNTIYLNFGIASGMSDKDTIYIQNSGNSMNPYWHFKGCEEKFIHLAKKNNSKGLSQTKEIQKKPEINSLYSIRIVDEKLTIKTADSVIIYNSSNLIRNADLLNTDFYRGNDENDFFLVYQNNASTTKTQSTYHLFVNKNDLFLISKEQVDLNGDGIFIAKNYIVPIKVTNMDYETMDEKIVFANRKNSIILKNKLKNSIFFNNIKAFEMIFSYKSDDFFIDYPVNTFKIGTLNLLDIKNSNDIAYYLEEAQIYDEAIFILKSIIKKEPTRVVAYLNLADSYWAIGNKDLAKENYKKYVELMKSQNKDLKKIPKEVWERTK